MAAYLGARSADSNGGLGSQSPLHRLLGYCVLAAVFPVLAFFAPPVLALRSAQEHAALDMAIGLSALFCGLQALVRYQSRPQPIFLWMGAGFLASGLLDGLHGLLSLESVAAFAGEARAGPWSWTASSLFLATYLVLSLGLDRPAESERNARLNALIVGGVTVALLLVVVVFLLLAPLRPPVLVGLRAHRVYEFLPAGLMLVALVVAWIRHAMLDAPIRRRLGVALVIYVSLHGGVMAWSVLPLDMHVGISHLAKLVAHWIVLVGLLQSSANLLTEVESSRRQLAARTDELEVSERRIRSIVDHAPFGILSADPDGRVRNFNPVAEQMFGVTRDRAIGRPLLDFFDPSDHADIAATLGPGEQATRARLLQTRQAGGDETGRSRRALSRAARAVHADGSTFPMSLTLTDTVAGGHRFFTAFVRDLTRTIEQEQKTHQALTLTTQILDQSTVAICSTDGAGLITRFNRTAQAWLGYSERDVRGRLTPAAFVDRAELQTHGKVLEREHGVPLTTDAEIFLALARRGEPDQREWTLIRKDGTRFPAHVAVAPLAAEGGQITGFVLVATDLSHQKEVDQLKNEFVSTVSHELRTPLTSVRGSLGLLAGGLARKLPAQAQSLLEIAQRNTERLILLINDILDMEKIEAGKMRFNLKSLDLDALVGDAVQSAEGLAATRSVQLARTGRRPGMRVFADDHRLVQVLTNLLSNAIKFSPDGGTVEIDVALHDDRARVTVTDHGAGIPEASQPRIFQKFFQADSSSAREKSGTGLGLSICKALVERMDGRMGFTSRPGETVFFFDLPREPTGRAGAARRILVVEDDSDAAAVLCQILGQAGFETETARSAAAAKELLQKRRYDCLTLDVMLPDQNGMALLAELRRQEYGRSIPIIIVSIYDADQPAQAAASAARVTDWLTKPIDSQRLLAAVRQALRLSGDSGVLLVEDDRPMAELLRRLLADITSVTVARTLAEGREQIERHPFSLVVLDLGLPDGMGHELLPVLQMAQPHTPVVIFSEKEVSEGLAGQVAKVLSKSRTSNEELVDVVQQILDGAEAGNGSAAENPAG